MYGIALNLIDFALALLIGAMLFFGSVVAPTVFKVFEAKEGGRFLRALFPRYYIFIIIASCVGLVGSMLLPHHELAALVFALVAASTLWVVRWLVPQLNKWRDQELAGDTVAAQNFKLGHRLSVLINLGQLAVIIALKLYAR